MPADKKTATQPRDYQQGSWTKKLVDLECPSGQWAQVKRPGLQGLLRAGVLESTDQLTTIVQNVTIPRAEGKPEIDAIKVLQDPGKIEELLSFIDKIVLHVVKQPVILPAPESDDDRDDDSIYVDDIDIDDKTFIVNFALGGSKDLERFRQESAEALGSVAAQPEASDQTK